jgi:hypothetical protein
MNGKSTIIKFSLIIGVIILVFLGYKFFFASAPADAPVRLVGLAPAGIGDARVNQASSDEFLALLSSLQAIDLNDLPRVLTLLGSLEDFSTDLQPQTPGRANPFSPIGVGGGITVETTVATTTATTSSATSTPN